MEAVGARAAKVAEPDAAPTFEALGRWWRNGDGADRRAIRRSVARTHDEDAATSCGEEEDVASDVEGRRDVSVHFSTSVLGARVRPVTLADQRMVPVPGELLPHGGLHRGTVISLEGAPGAGCTSVALALIAAVTAAGEWTAVVEPEGTSLTLSAPAAVEAGVILDRLAVVRGVPADRWAVVTAALVEGMSLVVAGLPPRVRPADARRLAARARERGSVLVALGPWPERATVRLRAEGGPWRLVGGRLEGRTLLVEVEGRGRTARRVRVA